MRTAGLALLLVSAPVHARVFQSLGPASETGQALASRAGWTLARDSRMEINGAPALVQVYSASAPRTKVWQDIRSYYQTLGATAEGREGATLAWLVGRESGLAVRYLLQPGMSDRQTLVTRIAMPEAAFNASLVEGLSDRARLTALPAPANAVHLNHQKADREGFEVEVSRVASIPEAALDGLRHAMESDGWQMTLPSRSGMCFYQRGRALAIISVKADEEGGALLTRAYKPE